MKKIPILKKLRALEEQAGKDVTLGATPLAVEPTLQDDQPKRQPRRRPRRNTQQDTEGESSQESKQKTETETGQRARQQPVRKEGRGSGRRAVKEQGSEGGGEEVTRRKLPQTVTTVYLGGIPTGLRVSELKVALRERKAAPLRLTWQGAQHRAFLDYTDPQVADQALEALQGLSLNGQSLQAELAKSQRGQRRSGQRQRLSTGQKPKMPQSDITKETEH